MHQDLEQLLSDERISAAQAELLNQWQPGTYVRHRSWGGGQIKSWDLSAGNLKIDFEQKPDHQMALKFAIKNLERLAEDHVISQLIKDRDALVALAQEDPKALIEEVAVSNGGSVLIDRIEDTLKDSVIPADDYKSWWESTKRKLRLDRRFVLPSKRSEPLVVRSAELNSSELFLEDLKEATDLRSKAKALGQILIHADEIENWEAIAQEVKELEERSKTSANLDLPGALELLLSRDDLSDKLTEGGYEPSVSITEILQNNQTKLGEQLRSLPVAQIRRILELYPEAFGEGKDANSGWVSIALGQIQGAGARGVSELARFLDEKGHTKLLIKQLEKDMRDRNLDQDALVWICRERTGAAQPLFTMDLGAAIIHELERDYYDEAARAGSRLAEQVSSDKELLSDLIEDASYSTVRNFARRLLGTPAFDDLTRKSLMARLLRVQPRLEELLTAETQEQADELIVSWASLEVRKKELDHLINKEMPANVKEIQVARSYGDLRENFEFKAAKEMKAVLERRRMELERDLSLAQGTDFAKADTNKVNIGTAVELKASGSEETITYDILGAWDGDVERNILSYQSATAAALLGKRVGETVDLNGVPHELISIAPASKIPS